MLPCGISRKPQQKAHKKVPGVLKLDYGICSRELCIIYSVLATLLGLDKEGASDLRISNSHIIAMTTQNKLVMPSMQSHHVGWAGKHQDWAPAHPEDITKLHGKTDRHSCHPPGCSDTACSGHKCALTGTSL